MVKNAYGHTSMQVKGKLSTVCLSSMQVKGKLSTVCLSSIQIKGKLSFVCLFPIQVKGKVFTVCVSVWLAEKRSQGVFPTCGSSRNTHWGSVWRSPTTKWKVILVNLCSCLRSSSSQLAPSDRSIMPRWKGIAWMETKILYKISCYKT